MDPPGGEAVLLGESASQVRWVHYRNILCDFKP